MTVREATPRDVSFIVAANQQMAQETEDRQLDRITLEAGVRAVLSEPHYGFYLIAEEDQQAVGTLLITPEWSDWRNGPIWWIQSVYVLPEARGRGVYRALHEEVVTRAKQQGKIRAIRLYVDRDNTNAQQVYGQLGMTASQYDLFEQEIPEA